jgi:MFS family permease
VRRNPFVAAWTSFRAVAREPRLGRSLLAFLLFNVADYATWVALMVFAHSRGGAPAAALIAIVQLVPPALVAPFGAMIGDRLSRDRALRFGYLLQASTLSLTAVVLWVDAPMAVIYTVAAVDAIAATLTRPVLLAAMPELASRPADLAAANSLAMVIEKGGVFVGPAMAALLLQFAGPAAVFALSAAGQALAAGLVVVRSPPAREQQRVPARAETGLAAALAGVRELRHARGAALMIGFIAMAWLAAGAVELLAVVLALDVLGAGEAGPGVLMSALGIGGLCGAAMSVMVTDRLRLATAIAAGMLLAGVPIAVAGLSPGLPVAVILFVLAGAGGSILDVAVRTLLQKTVRAAVLARVFGLQEGLVCAAEALGIALVPLLLAVFDPAGAFFVVGALLPALGLLTWRRLGRLDAATPPAPGLDLLRRSPIFGVLPPPELEALARCLGAEEAEPGEVIIRQGQLGDRYYLIEDGRVEVLVDGLPRPSRGPGESFGEIALVRNVPRSATVRAASPVRLLWLSRDDFLAALIGFPGVRERAHEVAGRRRPPGASA